MREFWISDMDSDFTVHHCKVISSLRVKERAILYLPFLWPMGYLVNVQPSWSLHYSYEPWVGEHDLDKAVVSWSQKPSSTHFTWYEGRIYIPYKWKSWEVGPFDAINKIQVFMQQPKS